MYVSFDFCSKQSVKDKDDHSLHLFLHLHRFQRSNTSAPAPFTPRSPATGATYLPSSTTRSKRSCFLRSLASPPALRSSWPACAWRWHPSPSTWCPRRGRGLCQRWCACFRRKEERWMGAPAVWLCWSSSRFSPRSSRPADCRSIIKDRWGALWAASGRPFTRSCSSCYGSRTLRRWWRPVCSSVCRAGFCWTFLWTRVRDWSRPVSRRWRIRSCSIRLWRPLSTPSHSPTHRGQHLALQYSCNGAEKQCSERETELHEMIQKQLGLNMYKTPGMVQMLCFICYG